MRSSIKKAQSDVFLRYGTDTELDRLGAKLFTAERGEGAVELGFKLSPVTPGQRADAPKLLTEILTEVVIEDATVCEYLRKTLPPELWPTWSIRISLNATEVTYQSEPPEESRFGLSFKIFSKADDS